MQRAYDMIIHDMALQDLPVSLCMDRGGLSGDDGPTHHGLFDIGYLRHVPGIVHMQPKDEDEFWTCSTPWPTTTPGPSPSATRAASAPAQSRKSAGTCSKSARRKFFGTAPRGDHRLGTMFEMAPRPPQQLEEQGISIALINPRWIKPLDAATIEFFARGAKWSAPWKTTSCTTASAAPSSSTSRTAGITTPVVRIGWPDQFIEHGSVPILRKKHGITAEAAVEKIVAALPVRKGMKVKSAA